MSDLTRDQFAEAVTAALRTVRHLHRELAKLYESLRDALESQPTPLRELVGPAGLRVRVRGEAKRPGLAESYTALFAASSDADLDDADEAETDEGDTENEADTGVVQIRTTAPLLAFRMALLDGEGAETFEPQIQYAILTDWRLGPKNARPGADGFQIRRHQARRLPAVLNPALTESQRARIETKASALGRAKGERRISCRLSSAVEATAIFDLDDAGALDSLASRMHTLWYGAYSPLRQSAAAETTNAGAGKT